MRNQQFGSVCKPLALSLQTDHLLSDFCPLTSAPWSKR
jgi:hypothetical protein